ncbi:hypothetical protein ACNOYE_37420 [Nannocystaceae bacterium ST9]
MRLLVRFLLAHPVLLFSLCAIVAIGSAIVAFVMAERRARAIAELAGDDQAKSSQVVRLVGLGLGAALAIASAGWWIFVRVHTLPQRVVIVTAIDPGDGQPPIPWWDEPRGSEAIAERLAGELEALGLEPVPLDAELREAMAGALDEAAFAERARALEARWVVSVVVRVDKTIPLIGADYSDYVTSSEAALIDSETGERWSATEPPLRAFLWGERPSEALALNAEYLADRLIMPIVARLGEREPLRVYADHDAQQTTSDRALANQLAKLFDRADNLAKGLELRERDRSVASKREPENRADVRRTRLGDVLAEEYMIGTAFDGRPIVLIDSKHVSVVPDKLGYVVTSEGEALELVGAEGRSLLFEHYNFYGASGVSADGRVVWATLANHGATKTLATIGVPEGAFSPVFTDPSEYMTNPIPAPDGSRALFYSRTERRAPTAIDVIDRDGSDRSRIVALDEVSGRPEWSRDGRVVYLPIDEWERIIAIDMTTYARTHLLGTPPAGTIEDPQPELDPEAALPPSLVGLDGAPPIGDVPEAEPEADVDPRATSRFPALSLGHDGSYLFVLEDALDGTRWVGRFDLAGRSYQRLAALDAQWLVASPTAARVAVQVRGFTQHDDPRPGDDEILVLGPAPRDVKAVTLDSEDDELITWSRDGASVFGQQRSSDPGARDRPVVRVYRYDL